MELMIHVRYFHKYSSNIHQLDISSILNGPCGMLMLVGSWMTKRNGMGWDELDIWEKTTRNVRADTMTKEALQYWVDSGRQRISTSTRTPTSSYVVVLHGQFLFLEKQSHGNHKRNQTLFPMVPSLLLRLRLPMLRPHLRNSQMLQETHGRNRGWSRG